MKDRRTHSTRILVGLALCVGAAMATGFAPGTIAKLTKAQAPSPLRQPSPANQPPPMQDDPPTEDLPTAKDANPKDMPTKVKTLDPDEDAVQFIAETKKEAADRIAALDKEANDLRMRLAKLEAATNRIKKSMASLLEAPPAKADAGEEPILIPNDPVETVKPKQP